jgi:hypothetical protein
MINERHLDFDIEVKGDNLDTHVMTVDFPFKTTSQNHASNFHGSNKDNAVLLYIGSTTHTS